MITWQCFEASLLPFVRADQQPPHYRPQKDDDNIDHNVQETANIRQILLYQAKQISLN